MYTLRSSILVIGTLTLLSCAEAAGSTPEEAVLLRAEEPAHAAGGHATTSTGKPFVPPPVSPGYVRFVPNVLKNVAPGDNVDVCQFIQAPLDHDVDVIDVQGSQSLGGHHVVAYATSMKDPVGTTRRCTDQDNVSLTGYLGGTGGEAGGGALLPPNVAFRLPKGASILVNTHFVNNTDAAFDGHSVIDFKFAEPSSDRLIASMLNNAILNFNIPAKDVQTGVAECTLPRQYDFILFSNHMHEWGESAKTEVIHADGSVELVHADRYWTPELAFRADFSKWSIDKPLTLVKGDRLRTTCNWRNTTTGALTFPAEMCIGIGFFLSKTAVSPLCIAGNWIDR